MQGVCTHQYLVASSVSLLKHKMKKSCCSVRPFCPSLPCKVSLAVTGGFICFLPGECLVSLVSREWVTLKECEEQGLPEGFLVKLMTNHCLLLHKIMTTVRRNYMLGLQKHFDCVCLKVSFINTGYMANFLVKIMEHFSGRRHFLLGMWQKFCKVLVGQVGDLEKDVV